MKANTKKNEENAEMEVESIDRKDFYLNEEAKNWDFSDYVRVTSGPRGMILSFGKFVREDEKYGIFKEITLPYDIVESFIKIMQEQFNQLIKDGMLRKIDGVEKK